MKKIVGIFLIMGFLQTSILHGEVGDPIVLSSPFYKAGKILNENVGYLINKAGKILETPLCNIGNFLGKRALFIGKSETGLLLFNVYILKDSFSSMISKSTLTHQQRLRHIAFNYGIPLALMPHMYAFFLGISNLKNCTPEDLETIFLEYFFHVLTVYLSLEMGQKLNSSWDPIYAKIQNSKAGKALSNYLTQLKSKINSKNSPKPNLLK